MLTAKRGNEFTLPLIRTVGMLKRLFVFTVGCRTVLKVVVSHDFFIKIDVTHIFSIIVCAILTGCIC